MKRIKTVLLLALCLALSGCQQGETDAGGSAKKTQYKYEDTKVIEQLIVTKTVYKDGELDLYVRGKIYDDYQVEAYDKNFEKIDSEWKVSYRKGVLKIEGENAEAISGLRLDNNIYRYEIRYLDSEQYAALSYSWAEDVGMLFQDGDKERYYTKEEIERQEADRLAYEREQQEYWELVKGIWVAEENESSYFEFFDEDGRHKFRQVTDGETTECYGNVDQIKLLEDQDEKEIVIYDGISWGCQYRYGISDELDCITENGVRYRKK